MDLGYVIGETLINAEEHSSLKYRYLIGYFEECNQDGKHFGLLNLVIMNFGQTIYEKFKYPIENIPINTECLSKMKNCLTNLNPIVCSGKTNLLKRHCGLYTLYKEESVAYQEKSANGEMEPFNSLIASSN